MEGGASSDDETVDSAREDNRTTVSSTSIDENYTVTIPATLAILFSRTLSTPSIQMDNVRLKAAETEGYTRAICVEAADQVDLTCGDSVISYALDWNSNIGESLAFTAGGRKNISVLIESSARSHAKAGDYEGRLTFAVDIGDVDMSP